ncbi:MAG: Aspartate racemase, partial [Candidatus Woesebacteria bacterium GW2011_GWC2_47_16]
MKTVGIIGGFGPETTAKFLMLLISLWQKKNQNTRPEILLWNAPVDNKIEQEFILTGKNVRKLLPLVISGARKLEAGGADFLVLPCNSLHIFMKNIRTSVGIPVLSIVEETTKFVAGKKIGRVGLLGTKATIKSGIFNSQFRKHHISILIPEAGEQTSLNAVIHNLVRGRKTNRDARAVSRLVKRM